MSRQSSLDPLSEDESVSGSHRVRRRREGYRMESQDSMASRDSMSRYGELDEKVGEVTTKAEILA